jgi:hypothetical protein
MTNVRLGLTEKEKTRLANWRYWAEQMRKLRDIHEEIAPKRKHLIWVQELYASTNNHLGQWEGWYKEI